ncbi:helicase C-terminal domain-containing protein [Paenibacillus sp. IHBB 10380]|uniref:helicase C-terminal domain-containing protein n=1 Tax=Paenibacillus sp. IHBB 10380 TaxID=1566358 RepID=UPI0005CFEDF8|nr:helicase C-terminal domain-containing protein [Paenibacillus sp. IHBB 10380]AJS60474.1 ATP-dependent helicase [Paenibacillus sp. IHBB 10380]
MEENKKIEQVRISVRPLVEYVFRSGDIHTGFRAVTALHEGTRIHQQVQRTYKEGDLKEVPLKTEVFYNNIIYLLEGRCDGLIYLEDGLMVDEIKSTSGHLADLQGGHDIHWAQAQFYAYMVAKEQNINHMQVQLTYIQATTSEEKQFRRTYTIIELEAFTLDVVKRYAPYISMRLQNAHLRNESIRALTFPFDSYREGQRKLAGAVYQTIKEGKKLFAKAPTGIGKTISTLFPSVKAIGEGLLQQIFYLTARTTTRTAAEQAFARMESKGLHIQTVTLTAKEKVCFQEEISCRKEDCPFADGYYDRINGAILDMLSQETLMDRSVIEQYARKHNVCPFEFSLDAAYAADVMICDYNYVYDPRVSLKRLFEEQKRQTVLLIDEAHNLVDRGREMFSAVIGKAEFLQLQRQFKGIDAGMFEASKAVNQYFIDLKKECGEHRQKLWKEYPVKLVSLLESFILQAETTLLQQGNGVATSQQLLLDTYYAAQNFIRIAKLYNERHVTYAEVHRNGVTVKMFCMDPSSLLSQAGKGFRAAIFFSATLSPLHYYRDMIGAGEEDYSLTIASPFHREQLDVRIEPLSTRYRDRENTKETLVTLLIQLVQERKGNYLLFFPSYQYLQDVYESFTEAYPQVTTIVQGIGMAEEEREAYLASFQDDNTETLVGFAVLGGIFAEGIDLQGDRLNGVAVVGVGLPQLGLERNLIKDYFNSTGKNGYDYSYVYPGMNKVLQAGGRLIRSEQDTGVLMLVDDRFLQRQYQGLMPEEWK